MNEKEKQKIITLGNSKFGMADGYIWAQWRSILKEINAMSEESETEIKVDRHGHVVSSEKMRLKDEFKDGWYPTAMPEEGKVCSICGGDQYACTCDEQSYAMPEEKVSIKGVANEVIEIPKAVQTEITKRKIGEFMKDQDYGDMHCPPLFEILDWLNERE